MFHQFGIIVLRGGGGVGVPGITITEVICLSSQTANYYIVTPIIMGYYIEYNNRKIIIMFRRINIAIKQLRQHSHVLGNYFNYISVSICY